MTVLDRETAAQNAENSDTNRPGMCQSWTRAQFLAPSAGDQDQDGDADAVDGWLSEPKESRHKTRKPPRGTPCRWEGGSDNNGHSAVSLGPIDGHYMIRTTDGNGLGRTATVPLDWPEKEWGLKWLGWSDTIDGEEIPKPTAAERKTKIQKAIDLLIEARDRARRRGYNARSTELSKRIRQLRDLL